MKILHIQSGDLTGGAARGALWLHLAMRGPVIGPKVNGVPELVEDGVNGFLIPPEDVDLLALRIEQLLNDGALAEKFVEKAYEKVKKDFDLNTEIGKLVLFFKDLG
ncbi:MAG: glycosyltransferase [Candidatus Moranbacteria bacterium]|nr:glycosyltransferase [Candidatus Moranbacteria bacterium]